MKRVGLPLLAAILGACAHPVFSTAGGGLAVDAPARPELAAATDPEAAAVDLYFAKARRVQDLPVAEYEVRAMYTEAVVRSQALKADYHAGVKARPDSLSGYSLNVPPAGSRAPGGAPRLRYAQHPGTDDPYFPSLADATRMLNPTGDPDVYFLGQGILKTAQSAGYPPPVLDVFAPSVSSEPIGSLQDIPSAKLGAAAVETALNSIWSSVTYDDPYGNHAIAPVIQDRPLTDNLTLTSTRYYKWRLPFAATALHLGGTLPLGRVLLDVRLIDSTGRIVASAGSARLLQAGQNALNVSLKYDSQGLVSDLFIDFAALPGMPALPPTLGPVAGDLLASYAVGTGPTDLAIAHPNGYVWVANRSAGTVSALTAGGSPVITIGGFSAPSGVALDPYGDLWVTDAANNTVTRMSQSGLLRDVVAVDADPEAVAIDTGGNVWVVATAASNVTKIAHNGLVLGSFPAGTSPRDVAFDGAGNVWITDSGGHQFVVLTPAGAPQAAYPAASAPIGLAFDLFGRVWTALSGSNAAGVFTGTGTPVASFPVSAAPRGVGIDAGATAWTTAEGGGNADVRAHDGTWVATPGTAAGPRGVAVDDYRGSVWVAEYGGGTGSTVRKLSTGPLLTVGSTLAGSGAAAFADGAGGAAAFNAPEGVVTDGSGNVYVADTANHRIRKITSGGTATTLAGSGIQGWTDGPGYQARFTSPSGIAIDSLGVLYVADRGSHTIRKVTQAGAVSTLAGSGLVGYTDGSGMVARFDNPRGIAVDSSGNVYVTETDVHRIRRIKPDGVTATFATSGQSGFAYPRGLAVDPYGNILVASSGEHRVRRITPAGVVSILTGMGIPGYVNGPIGAARFNTPVALCFDGSGNLYVLDQGNARIRRISPSGVVTTVAGDGAPGMANGHPLLMRFSGPLGLAIGPSGIMAVADTSNHRIRKLAPPPAPPAYLADSAPTVSTLAGSGANASIDGSGSGASFYDPYGVALTPAGNLIVTEREKHRIRIVSSGGVVGTLTGWAGQGYLDDSLLLAQFNRPTYAAVDAAGNVFVADQSNHRIRYIDIPGATVSTAAGTGSVGAYVDGPATDSARFNAPLGVAIDGSGNVFVADFANNVIRKLDTAGNVSTYAGTAFSPGGTDGPPGVGKLNGPHGLAIDSAGDLYATDFWGHTVRKILPGGTIVTIGGAPLSAGYKDGPYASARFNMPTGIGVDAVGNVFVSDTMNHRIREIDTAGLVTTYAGSGPAGGGGSYANGSGSNARFNLPMGLAVTAGGTVYLVDSANYRIRKIVP